MPTLAIPVRARIRIINVVPLPLKHPRHLRGVGGKSRPVYFDSGESGAYYAPVSILTAALVGACCRGRAPPLQPDLKLYDTVPFRLSRNHFMIEKRNGSYYVRDLCSTLGTIVNGEPIDDHFRGDDAALRTGENEVIAGGVDSPFVFSVFIA
jgi:hypothetical protein